MSTIYVHVKNAYDVYPANFTQCLRYNVAAAITGSYRFVSLSHSRDPAPASH